MPRLVLTLLIAASFAACVSQRPLESQPCPCATGWSCDTTRNVCVADGAPDYDAGGGNSSLPVVGPGCAADCSTPAGTVQLTPTPADVYAAVAGRWRICRNWPGGFAPSGVVGIEFGPTQTDPTSGAVYGDAYYLVNGPAGPARGQGFEYQLTYDVYPEGPSSTQLDIHPTPNSGLGGSVRYSPCPMELEINLFDPGAILVPMGG